MNIISTILKLFKVDRMSVHSSDILADVSDRSCYTTDYNHHTIIQTLPLCLHTIIFKFHFSDIHPHHLEPLELLKNRKLAGITHLSSSSAHPTIPRLKRGLQRSRLGRSRGGGGGRWGESAGHVWMVLGPVPIATVGSQTGPPDRCT